MVGTHCRYVNYDTRWQPFYKDLSTSSHENYCKIVRLQNQVTETKQSGDSVKQLLTVKFKSSKERR